MFVLISLTLTGQYVGESEFYKTLVGSGFGEFLFVFALSLAVSYALSILNVPLTQLYEGYFFKQSWPGRLMTLLHIQRKEWLDLRLKQINDTTQVKREAQRFHPARSQSTTPWSNPKYWEAYQQLVRMQTEQAVLRMEKQTYFPVGDELVMPTRLGNVMASFEEYPVRSYGMNAVTIWPRMLPTVLKSGYAELVEREKMGFDFFLNLSALTGFLALEYAGLSLYFAARMNVAIVLAIVFGAWVFYRLAILAAIGFGTNVKVSFDLHRNVLRKDLGLVAPLSFEEEVAQWEKYSSFLGLSDRRDKIAVADGLFAYERPAPPARVKASRHLKTHAESGSKRK